MNKAISIKQWNRIYTVSTEGPCNLSCLGCGSPRLYKERTVGEIISDIEKGAKLNYERIEIVGGEPTMHKDIFLLLSLARNKYKYVNLTTNAINLADEIFCSKIISLVDEVNISLDGHNAITHEQWTKSKGSFDKTIQGIKNCIKKDEDKTSVTHLIWKGNYKKIRKMLELDLTLGLKKISLLNLQPVGKAKKIYKDLVVRLSDLKNFDLPFADLIEKFKIFDLEDFPQCVFSNEILEKEKKNVNIIDIAGQFFIGDDGKINVYDLFMAHNLKQGIDSTSKAQKNIKYVSRMVNDYRVHLGPCSFCKFKERCNGIFLDYVKVFGEKNTEAELETFFKE